MKGGGEYEGKNKIQKRSERARAARRRPKTTTTRNIAWAQNLVQKKPEELKDDAEPQVPVVEEEKELISFEWYQFNMFFKHIKRTDFNDLFALMLSYGEHVEVDPYLQDIKQIQFGVRQPIDTEDSQSSNERNSSSNSRSRSSSRVSHAAQIEKPEPCKLHQFQVLWHVSK